jgi:hypothetical protein
MIPCHEGNCPDNSFCADGGPLVCDSGICVTPTPTPTLTPTLAPTPTCEPDFYEDDDTPGIAQEIDFTALGSESITQQRDFDVKGDQNWYRLMVVPGATYYFETGDLGPLADTFMRLYEGDASTEIDGNDDCAPNQQHSCIDWIAPIDMVNPVVYLKVYFEYDFVHECYSDYTVTLTQTLP